MFKNIKHIKTIGQAVQEVSDGVNFVQYHIEENKNAYIAAGLGFVAGVALVSVFRAKPVVVNNVINVCSHAS